MTVHNFPHQQFIQTGPYAGRESSSLDEVPLWRYQAPWPFFLTQTLVYILSTEANDAPLWVLGGQVTHLTVHPSRIQESRPSEGSLPSLCYSYAGQELLPTLGVGLFCVWPEMAKASSTTDPPLNL